MATALLPAHCPEHQPSSQVAPGLTQGWAPALPTGGPSALFLPQRHAAPPSAPPHRVKGASHTRCPLCCQLSLRLPFRRLLWPSPQPHHRCRIQAELSELPSAAFPCPPRLPLTGAGGSRGVDGALAFLHPLCGPRRRGDMPGWACRGGSSKLSSEASSWARRWNRVRKPWPGI